jgi:hypothetical protein
MLGRKQFLHRALGTCAGALGLTVLHECGDERTVSTIRTNHGHVLVVSKADVAARAQKVYDIRGSADHTHWVTISEDQMGQLAIHNAIMTVSTLNASRELGTHRHDIIVACL